MSENLKSAEALHESFLRTHRKKKGDAVIKVFVNGSLFTFLCNPIVA